ISLVWNYAEGVCIGESAGSWGVVIDRFDEILASIPNGLNCGQAEQQSADRQSLPDDIASATITDPPYYDAVPYADLSDFFFVWQKRAIATLSRSADDLTPKNDECIVDDAKGKDRAFFETKMAECLREMRRILMPSGVGTV